MSDDTEFDQSEEHALKPKKKAARVPESAKRPQDYKPKAIKQSGAAARRREAADDEFVTLEQCGVEFMIPADQNEWPLKAIDFMSQGRELDGMKEILGREQWAELVDSGAKLKDLNELGEKFADAFGFGGLGN